jgi:O-antigen/teichoic acid export membrane protein
MSFKKLGYGLIVQIFIKFIAIGLGLYTARWSIYNIDSAILANFTTLLSLASTVLTIINFGIPNIIQMYYTNYPKVALHSSLFSTLTFVRLLTLPLGLFLMYVLLPLSGVGDTQLALNTFTLLYILVFDLNFRSLTDAIGTSWKYSISDFIGKFVIVALLAFNNNYYFYFNSAIYIFIHISFIGYLIGLCIDIVWQKPNYSIQKPSFRILKEYSKPIMYLGMTNILVSIYLTTDKLFLKKLGFPDLEIVGYSNAYRLLEISMIIPGLTTPIISSFAKKRLQNEHTHKIDRQFNLFINKIITLSIKKSTFLFYLIINFMFSFITLICLNIFGPLMIRIIDTNIKYSLALDYLPILSLALLPLPILGYLGSMIVFYGGEKQDFVSYIVIAICGLTLYSILIPLYGGLGASIATVMIYIIDVCIKLILIKKVNIFVKL